MSEQDLVETGIQGLDDVLGGGINRTAAVLVSGNPGTGKSLLGMQYLYEGVRQFDESGVYLSFEENQRDIREAAESIGFDDWAEYVEDGDIVVYDKRDLLREGDFTDTIDRLLNNIEMDAYERLVMDSLTMFGMFFDNEKDKRTYLLRFIDILKDSGQTSLLTNEQAALYPETGITLENFLTDGNIYLSQVPTKSGANRYLWIPKMRRQDVRSEIFPMDIEHGGIKVYPESSGFAMMEEEAEFGFGI
jgi:KaiC/GvpD/RAD55 family RecA-like ATPase